MTETTRFGVALLLFLAAVATCILGFREKLPEQNTLSTHRVIASEFGPISTSHRAQDGSTFYGYGFVIDEKSIPEKYDASTHPWVSEPAATPPLGKRIVIFHPAIELTDNERQSINNFSEKPIDLFFYQGKVVAMQVGGKTVVNWSRAAEGFAQQRMRYWTYSGLLFGAALIVFALRKYKTV